jgi:hypothetical protein
MKSDANGITALAVKRVGIDTYRENVAYLHRRCPLYLSEGFRAALTPVPHMSLLAVYPVLIGFTALFTHLGIKGFTNRVIA